MPPLHTRCPHICISGCTITVRNHTKLKHSALSLFYCTLWSIMVHTTHLEKSQLANRFIWKSRTERLTCTTDDSHVNNSADSLHWHICQINYRKSSSNIMNYGRKITAFVHFIRSLLRAIRPIRGKPWIYNAFRTNDDVDAIARDRSAPIKWWKIVGAHKLSKNILHSVSLFHLL